MQGSFVLSLNLCCLVLADAVAVDCCFVHKQPVRLSACVLFAGFRCKRLVFSRVKYVKCEKSGFELKI
jgi:hypothetical protein